MRSETNKKFDMVHDAMTLLAYVHCNIVGTIPIRINIIRISFNNNNAQMQLQRERDKQY